MTSENVKGSEPEFAYISPPPSSRQTTELHNRPDDIQFNDAGWDRIKRKMRENPLVPIGVAVTTFALTYGVYQLKTGNKEMSQKMMRLRVGAQGFTIFALIGGLFYSGYQKKLADAEKRT